MLVTRLIKKATLLLLERRRNVTMSRLQNLQMRLFEFLKYSVILRRKLVFNMDHRDFTSFYRRIRAKNVTI